MPRGFGITLKSTDQPTHVSLDTSCYYEVGRHLLLTGMLLVSVLSREFT
jgi:hypothetical protein